MSKNRQKRLSMSLNVCLVKIQPCSADFPDDDRLVTNSTSIARAAIEKLTAVTKKFHQGEEICNFDGTLTF